MNFLKLFPAQATTRPAISRPIHHIPARRQTSEVDIEKHNYIKNISNSFDESLKPTFYDNTLPPRPPPRSRCDIMLSTLHILSVLLSLTAITIISATIPLWNRNFIHTTSPIKGDWTDGLLLVPLSLTFFSSLYLAIQSLRSRQRNYHDDPKSSTKSDENQTNSNADPFYTIILSLTLLITFIPTITLSTLNSLAQLFQRHIPPPPSSSTSSSSSSSQSPSKCTLTNILTQPCLPILYKIGNLQITFLTISSIITIYWIIILVWSIKILMIKKREEKRRREERRARRIARRQRREQRERNGKYDDDRGYHGEGSRSETTRSARDHKQTTIRNDGSVSQRPARVKVSSNSKRVKEWEGSNAVRLAQHNVMPKETIQRWLAGRHS